MTRRRRLMFYVIVLTIAFAGWKGWGLYQAILEGGLALRSGQTSLPGLQADVVVQTDEWGVPYLSGGSLEDVVRAMGWVHANDRFAQMELNRRVASARLAEVVGQAGLEMDRTMLELRVRGIAEKAVANMRPDSLELLKVYADGVNAWLDSRGDDLQPFFQLTGVEPEPWTPVDSMCVPALLAVSLSFINKRAEEERYLVLRELGVDAVLDWIGEDVEVPKGLLDLVYEPEWMVGGESAPLDSGTGNASVGSPGSTPGGSNNWAVSGALSANGSALVANDPHLGLRLPSIWYQIHLRCPQMEVAGMSIAGVPGVVLGHNRNLAWAFTNVMMDDNDLLFEKANEDLTQVWRDGEWLDVRQSSREILVDGGDSVEVLIYETDLGPMLPPVAESGLPARTLLWSAYHLTDPMTPFLDMAKASTIEEAIAAANRYQAPAQNVVIGHTDGRIAWTLFGRSPQRNRDMGRLPSPAWDASYRWSGLAEASANPVIQPGQRDSIVTANSLVEGGGESLQADYDTPFRRTRISELLQGKSGWTAESLSGPQSDVQNSYALYLLAALPNEIFDELDKTAQGILNELRRWDGVDEVEGPAALFWLFERELWSVIFDDELKKHHIPMPWTFLQRQKLLRVLEGKARHPWADNVNTEEFETLNQAIALALHNAWQSGVKQFGDNLSTWSYGEKLHYLTLPHHLDAVPILGGQFTRGPYAVPGSATSVSALGGTIDDWKKVVWGPSMRVVWDSGDWENSRAILPGGQSGHFNDPHYDDQLPLYLNGKTRVVPWSPRAIDAAAVSTIKLSSLNASAQ